MKKFMYLKSGIFNEKYPTNGAIVLQYDSDNKTLSVIDLVNKEEVLLESGSSMNEALNDYVAKADLDELRDEFVEKIKGFFKIQGTCTAEELEEKEKIEGHWWQVGDKEYVWNGNAWVEVGFEISMEEYAKLTDLPTKLSDLENDEGFLKEHQSLSGYATKDDIIGFISEESDPKFAALSGTFAAKSEIPTKVSELENDKGFISSFVELDPVFMAQSGQFALKSELEELISEELDPKFAALSGTFANNEETEINLTYLLTKLSKVIKDVEALKHETNVTTNSYNPQIIKAEAGSISLTDTSVDAIVTSQEIEGKTTINVKSMEVDNSTINIEDTKGLLFNINAKEDVSITNTDFNSNTIDSSVDLIYLTSAEVFKLDGVTFTGKTYNTVMTGQNTSGKYLKYADIINCNFNEFAQHINIWFAGWQDNAVLNIKNCKFSRCEQFLCLGDYHGEVDQFNNKLTINIEDCEIEEYEVGESDQYSGIILCDSRKTSGSEQFNAKNPFGNGKVVINIKNVTAGGVKLTKDNFLMGTKNAAQMLYVYQATGLKNISFTEDTKILFPTIYVDDELISQLV